MTKVIARALLAGLLLAASLPPWGWWPLAFVGLVLLDRLIGDQPVEQDEPDERQRPPAPRRQRRREQQAGEQRPRDHFGHRCRSSRAASRPWRMQAGTP